MATLTGFASPDVDLVGIVASGIGIFAGASVYEMRENGLKSQNG